MACAQTARHGQAAGHQTGEPAYRLSLVLRRSREVHRVDFTHGCIVGLLERVRGELGEASLRYGRDLRDGVSGKGEEWAMEPMQDANRDRSRRNKSAMSCSSGRRASARARCLNGS